MAAFLKTASWTQSGSLEIFFGLRGYLAGVGLVFSTTTAVREPLRTRSISANKPAAVEHERT